MRSWSRRISLMMIFVVSFFCLTTNAQEKKIVSLPQFISKSIMVFSKYVNWPMNCKNGEFKIAVIGDKAVFNELSNSVQGIAVGTQNIHVYYFNKVEDMNGFNHIIFLSETSSWSIKKLNDKIGADNTLIVSSSEGLIQKGAAINFKSVDGLMKFEMSKANIHKRNLEVHSWLEKMAVSEG
jgi:hypothetical protein